MSEPIVAWQAARERMVYRYLTALEEQDIETVLDVLAKAQQDTLLEEMLWQIHEVNFQEELASHELETLQNAVSEKRESAEERLFDRPEDLRRRKAPEKPRRLSYVLQIMAAVIVVCALIGGFQVLRGARQNSGLTGDQPGFKCFVTIPAPQVSGWLVSVATLAENDIWAIGGQYASGSSTPTTLIEHWDGQDWKVVASPNVTGMSNVLVSVTALSDTDIWAVGQTAPQYSGPVAQTLVEHWDGQHWQIVPSPNLLQQASNTLTGIAAVDANDIWAVGIVNQASPSPGHPHEQALIEHWDGRNWHIVPNPIPATGATGSSLASVVAISKENVWTVGTTEMKPLIEHWDGKAWSTVAGPDLSGGLASISAAGAEDIWAAGSHGILEHWDGQSWQASSNDSRLTFNGVLALASDDVWATGNTPQNSSNYGTLIEHWDGQKWSEVTSPDPGQRKQRANDLYALTSSPAGKIWIVGSQQVSRQTPEPLILASSC